MIFNFFKKFFVSKNQRLLNKYSSILSSINSFEKDLINLSDFDIKSKFLSLKSKNYVSDKDIIHVLSYSYSIVREVSKRTLNMRHFDVQILAGIALFYNKIIEVATGEGKTLIATLPICLNFLLKRSVHLVTVNDYLANRDANWMRPIYEFLGLSVGIIKSNMTNFEKKNSYNCDVVYGTCNEFGFDYLRDNIVFSSDDKVQSSLSYAILDEVDSILIDEARTPLIISLPEKNTLNYYFLIRNLTKKLVRSFFSGDEGDFILDFELKNVYLTDHGFNKAEDFFNKFFKDKSKNLYDVGNIELLHMLYAALKAEFFFKKDVDYIVSNNEILIIDDNTGRIMEGRRWSDGLHQAIEAKEGLKVKNESQTLASITFQNFFRLYNSLSGMTGTAFTESSEFDNIYKLEVVVVPTNKVNIRVDNVDLVFLTKRAKYNSIISDIKSCYDRGQPVLVGTISIDVSEFISSLLNVINIKHNVLNAKHHAKESIIISEAGKLKSVTIATNMAGRGTDIVLGLSDINDYKKIVSLGGLKVIGTERHESRRIDNQLRGRCARQGDPGCTQFYISLEDDLIKIFMGDNVLSMLNKLNLSENDVISNSIVMKSIESAQRKIESYNFDVRKQLLEYDDMVNEQRKVFYQYRDNVLFSKADHFINDLFFDLVDFYFLEFSHDLNALLYKFNTDLSLDLNINTIDYNLDTLKSFLIDSLLDLYKSKKSLFENFDLFERSFFLNILDFKWREHLINLDYLKKGIYLRGYAQKDPKEEYKKESFSLFSYMLHDIKREFVVNFFKIPLHKFFKDYNNFSYSNLNFNHDSFNTSDKSKNYKIGRNDMCYCNSKKKYKYCHGKNT